MMAWSNDCSWLCSTLCPCPGSAAAARFAPYSSTLVPFFPKYLPTSGAMMGYGCPRYVVIATWNTLSPM